ncbi:P-loop NTPase fold protein [Peribacillus sp. V2I11]|uniref:P-loop NTPase fold protein n=1 Tax=Peribacillus sp. V2I11 TaxID=3042277 RepID=UPI0027896A9A|nr:P-loop NTPase fold protein [Peribacillus sp. V2I11]MDQ0884908.1 putative KAP-like P-loop ATPase [Peribacillus sp. V2I11]
MTFKPDRPILHSGDDRLNRSGFAEHLAKAILKYEFTESLVLGLYGKWGSGKTSVINMAVEEIVKLSKEVLDQEKPIIMKFNPWNYSGHQQPKKEKELRVKST